MILKKFSLSKIDHPLINKIDNYKILINENCLLIADWIESWLNINSKLKIYFLKFKLIIIKETMK